MLPAVVQRAVVKAWDIEVAVSLGKLTCRSGKQLIQSYSRVLHPGRHSTV